MNNTSIYKSQSIEIMIHKILKLTLILSFLLLGCTTDDDANCSFNDPVTNLPWLEQKINEIEETSGDLLQFQYVLQAVYQKNPIQREIVFVFGNCCPVCSTVVPVYNCNGMLLGVLGLDVDSSAVFDYKVIWSPENFECVLNTN